MGTYLFAPDARLRFVVRLARLASRSPDTILPLAPASWPPPMPPAPLRPACDVPCGCSMSPKKDAPTAEGKEYSLRDTV